MLVAVGLVVRLAVMETPAFRRMQAAAEVSRVPAVDVLRDPPSRRNLGWTLLARWAEGASFNTWGVFVLTYTVATLKMPRTEVLVGGRPSPRSSARSSSRWPGRGATGSGAGRSSPSAA